MVPRPIIRLQSSWSYRPTPEGVEIFSVIRGSRLLIRGPSTPLIAFMRALEAGVEPHADARALAERCGVGSGRGQALMSELHRRQALVATTDAPKDLAGVYDRQVRFLDLFETPAVSGSELNRRLQDRSVAIIGLGGYGTWLALLCARIGIRRIIGIDPDRVEQSNLSRQVLFGALDVGTLKVDAARRALAEFGTAVQFDGRPVWIATAAELAAQVRGVDLVFNAFGYAPNPGLEAVAEGCGSVGVPSLLLGGSWIGPLTVPRRTPCFWCLSDLEAVRATVTASQARYASPTREQPNPAFAPRMAITASVAVWEAVRFLSGLDAPPTLKGLITLDLFAYRQPGFVPVELDPACRRCSAWPLS